MCVCNLLSNPVLVYFCRSKNKKKKSERAFVRLTSVVEDRWVC